MRINPKSQKGAITLVVLVTMLFLTAFLMTMYIRVANKAEISAETTAEILKKYNNIGDKNSLYYSYFTDSNIIPITNRAELEEIGSNKNITVKGKVYKFIPNGNYIVMNDIDLGGEETPWIPIPEKNEQNENRFTGVLDGLGYTIKGLYINDSSLNNQGLFSILNGTVRNINISNSYLNGKDNVGAIAGTNGTNGLIENCFNKSTVIGINYVGGIVGNSNGTVKNCKNVGNIIGQTNVIGGYFYVINENQEVPVEVWSKTSTLSQNYYFKSGTDVATVPKGFKVSANLDEQTIKDGLVIEDSDENEFVWVPVAEFEEDINTVDQTAYQEIRDSINAYKGFYIGKTETAYTAEQNIGIREVTVEQSQDLNNHIKWNGENVLVKLSSNLYTNKSLIITTESPILRTVLYLK